MPKKIWCVWHEPEVSIFVGKFHKQTMTPKGSHSSFFAAADTKSSETFEHVRNDREHM